MVNGEPWAKIGDRIRYAKNAGSYVKDENGEKLVVLEDQDIMVVIEEVVSE